MRSANTREKSLLRQIEMIDQKNKKNIQDIVVSENLLKETKETIAIIDCQYMENEARAWLFTENYLKFRSNLDDNARKLSAEIVKLSGDVASQEKSMEHLVRLLDQLRRASARRSAEIELAEFLTKTKNAKVSHGQGGRTNLR